MISLNAPLPLRSTTVWGNFAHAAVIPQRYGATSGRLLQYDATGRLWCWTDHPCMSIDDVTVAGQSVSAWQWRNITDPTGAAVAIVEFGQPQDASAEIVASGRGKLHAASGELLTSPADVLYDLLAVVAGLDVGTELLAQFRVDCAARGLICAGSVDAQASIQAAARSLCASVGAVFCGSAAPVALLWPGGPNRPAISAVPASAQISARCNVDDLCTDITINFDVADGAARAAIQLEAPDAVRRYGRRAKTLDAPWIAEARVAYDVAARLLQQAARPQWHIGAAGLRRASQLGDSIDITHPASPASGAQPVLSAQRDPMTGLTNVAVAAAVGDAPAVRLVRQSQRYAPQQFAAAAVATAGDERILTVQDTDGSPLAGASVTLDGQITRTSDAAGQVRFPLASMPPGQHTLRIVTADGRTLETTVLVQ